MCNPASADFDHVLVYDISRWGRFQDVDESAHYEFVCKQKGIQVAYCAEQFDNDGSLLSSIVKNIKRVMAAEFSRELSVKVHAGQCRIAGLGYRVGGPLTFGLAGNWSMRTLARNVGLRRENASPCKRTMCGCMLDLTKRPRSSDGYSISLSSSESRTAKSLGNSIRRGSPIKGDPGLDGMIHTILKNENYIGNIVYNRTTRRLGQKQANNPHHSWVRGLAVIDPIVDPTLFARAQKIMAERRVEISEDQMLLRLRVALNQKGKLNSSIINNTAGLPSVSSYTKHFGTLRRVYSLLGYLASRNCDWIDTRDYWSDVLTNHATQVAEALRIDQALRSSVEQNGANLMVNGLKVTFLAARQLPKRGTHHAAQWRAYCRRISVGLVVVLRLNPANKAVLDYVVLPAPEGTGPYVRLSNADLIRRNAVRIETLDDLIQEIRARAISSNYTAPAKRPPQNKRRKSIRRKTKNARARR